MTALLSGAVIFGTISLLTFPALTMTKEPCELTEHQHTEDCYEPVVLRELTCEESLNLHSHREACYDEKGSLICGKADFFVHSHNSFCFDDEGNLVCSLPEIQAHTHTDSCYAPGETSVEGGHQHTDECYSWEYELVSGTDSGEQIYAEDLLSDGEEDFGLGSGESYEYVRGDLICGQEESETTVTQNEPRLICDKTEIKLHTHTEECAGTCTALEIKEHTHTEACITESPGEPVLICGLEEHTHDENCMPEAFDEENVPENVNSRVEAETEEDTNPKAAASEENMNFKDDTDSVENEESEEDIDSGDDADSVGDTAEDDEEIDFTKWIRNVTIQKRSSSGSPWEDVVDGNIKKDDEIRFHLDYTIPAYQLDTNHKTIKYPLPEGIHTLNDVAGSVYNSGGQEIGTYSIIDGVIHISFNDTIEEENEAGESIIGYVNFTAKVNEEALDDTGDTDIQFSESITFHFHAEDKQIKTEDLHVEKTAMNVDTAAGTVTYQIEVTSENGTAGEVALQDVMNNIQLDGAVTVEGYPDIAIETTSNGFNLTLPQMSADGKYIITYTAKIPDSYVNGTVQAQNTVSVDSTRSDGAKLHDDQTIRTDIEHKLLEKTGVKTEEGKLRWTIVVNGPGMDISGWTLSDKLNDIPWTGTVSISPAVNGQSVISLPYTFPTGSNQTYTITYETDAEKKPGLDQAINTAILTPNDDGKPPITVDGWGWIGDGSFNPLDKTADISDASDRTPDSDGNIVLPWTLTVNTSDGPLAAGWILYDELENGQWFTREQLQTFMSAFSGLNYTMKAWLLKPNGDKGDDVTALSDGQKYKAIELTFTDTLEKGRTYTVHYNSTAPVSSVGTKTFHNKATINNNFEHKPKITYSGSTTPTIQKYDANAAEEEGDTSHNYDTEKLTPAWYIDVTIPAGFSDGRLTVDEILPSGVTMNTLSYEENGISHMAGTTESQTDVYYTEDSRYRIVHIRIPEAVAKNDTGSARVLRFRIDVDFDEDVSWTDNNNGTESRSFKNSVQLLDKSGKKIDDDSQNQDFSRTIELPAIGKSAGNVKDNIIPYVLEINPYGTDLVPNAATLTLEDVLKYQAWNGVWFSASLVPGSVHVYHRNADGSQGEELSEAEYTQHYVELEDASDPYNPPIYTRMLTLVIPDSTPMIVTYNYLVRGTIGQWPTFTNTATLKGVSGGDTSDGTSTKIQIVDSDAGAEANGIVLYKVDSENTGLGLAGAEFQLWRWNGAEYELVKNGESETYVTPSDGRLHLVDLSYNTAYKLQEVKAPEGYQLDDSEYYFLLKNSDINTYPESKPSDFQGTSRFMGDMIYRSNEKEPMGPELPETGGIGTIPYTVGGLLMLLSAAFLLCRKNLYRREGHRPL